MTNAVSKTVWHAVSRLSVKATGMSHITKNQSQMLSRSCDRGWPGQVVSYSTNGLFLCLCIPDFIRIKWAWQKQQDVSEFYLQLLPAILQGNTPITATVKGLFEFDLTASLKCPRCKDITSQTNPQYNLDIHVNIGDHLSNILRETTFRGSVIHGRRCSRCKNTSNVRQPYRLVNGPEILILNMLRFTNKLYKNMSRVSFTQDLDLTEYTMPRTELKYRLVAVIQQKGTLHSGHYKAVAQCPGGKWQDLNDSSVTTVGINDALNPGGGWTPYMLFWTRSDKSKPVQRL